jgi:hypothetical protein
VEERKTQRRMRRPLDALRRFPTHKASVTGRLRDVGDGALAGLWGCSVVGAATVLHPWGAGGSVLGGAFQRVGRWLRRWRQHLSRTMVGALSGRRAVAALHGSAVAC